jgi:hypothetical protein
MTSAMIIDAIAAWKAILTDGKAMVSYFDQGNRFSYENASYPETSEYIHAYLGIHDNKLMFFLIPEAYDKEEYAVTIDEYTRVCPVYWTLAGSHTIPDLEAKARMDRWKDEYKSWVPKQAEQPVGMFRAFNIYADDFESEGCVCSLGLQIGGVEGFKTADLIVANQNDKTLIQFDDYVKPVPPFSASAAAENFYLLQL